MGLGRRKAEPIATAPATNAAWTVPFWYQIFLSFSGIDRIIAPSSLEFLVAGDIIRTVAVSPTLENLYVLGLIVLIRTFLSMSLEIELEGRLPWRGSAS